MRYRKPVRVQKVSGKPCFTRFPDWVLDNLQLFKTRQVSIIAHIIRKNDYQNPSKEFSVRYIAREIGSSKSSVHRDLGQLKDAGIVIQIDGGRRKIGRYEIPESVHAIETALAKMESFRLSHKPRKNGTRKKPKKTGNDAKTRIGGTVVSHNDGTNIPPDCPTREGQLIDPYTVPLIYIRMREKEKKEMEENKEMVSQFVAGLKKRLELKPQARRNERRDRETDSEYIEPAI